MVPECTKVFMNMKALKKIIYCIHKCTDKIPHCSISPGKVFWVSLFIILLKRTTKVKIGLKSIKV